MHTATKFGGAAPFWSQQRCKSTHAASSSAKQWELPDDWEMVIGVECHAQLKGPTKLFSPTPLPSLMSPHNTLASAFDAAHPGTLPTLQPAALDKALRAALILHCRVAQLSRFDRKHYFYADLPAGYQLTQKYSPFARRGFVELKHEEGYLPAAEPEVTVEIQQIQLEQDTAKSFHSEDGHGGPVQTLIDLNRCGAGLLEIVSGPQMRSPAQVGAYIRKLQELLRRVGASDGDMDKGSLRCDVNVSVRRKSDAKMGTRCEVKNVNSVKFVQNAIRSEAKRQYELLTSSRPNGTGDQPVVRQETRGYDEATGQTISLRSKEEAEDYRYMPDANLPALQVTPRRLERIRSGMPEHPDEQRQRLILDDGLSVRDVNVLMRIGLEEGRLGDGGYDESSATVDGAEKWYLSRPGEAVEYYQEVLKVPSPDASSKRTPKTVANWIVHDVLKALNAANASPGKDKPTTPSAPSPAILAEFIDLVEVHRKVTVTTAKAVLADVICGNATITPTSSSSSSSSSSSTNTPVLDLLTQKGMLAFGSSSNGPEGTDELRTLCEEIVSSCTKEVSDIRDRGQVKVYQRLVGNVMKRTQGRADAKRAREVLVELVEGADGKA